MLFLSFPFYFSLGSRISRQLWPLKWRASARVHTQELIKPKTNVFGMCNVWFGRKAAGARQRRCLVVRGKNGVLFEQTSETTKQRNNYSKTINI